ncbi:MAG TPA: MarR family transcriptional regulator [Jatrophihabitans sp.]|nr:MarR family transcriptional regulator [Jatrophihabitans sp.]
MAGFTEDDAARLRIAFARISRSIERTSADVGYTRSQLSVLGTIVRLKSAGMGELAEQESLNPTMLSRVVGKLEAAGLIVRTPDVDDRRAVQVAPTPAGRSLHLKLRKRRSDLISAQLAGLSPGRSEQLLQALPALEELAEHMLVSTRKVLS